jgi:hypothetical protein
MFYHGFSSPGIDTINKRRIFPWFSQITDPDVFAEPKTFAG